MADFLNGIFISELLVDNAGSGAFDTDADGSINKADEYIELGNVSGAPIDLDGFELWSEKNGLLFSFGAGDVLDNDDAATVVGNYSGTPPSGFYSAGLSESGDFLPDGEGPRFDTVFLVNTNSGEYITFSYGDPPQVPTLPGDFPGTTNVGSGESMQTTGPNGVAFARNANGDFEHTTPTPNTPDIACFSADTVILTRMGEKPVSALRPGDLIPTYDNGHQPLLGICALHLSAGELLRNPTLRPLVVDGRVLQSDKQIRLSPAHALMFTSAFAETLFASAQVLLRARHLQNAGLARSEIPRHGVTYYHLLFGDHELVMANGFWCESYFHSRVAEFETDFPRGNWSFASEVALETCAPMQAARPVLRNHEAMVLIDSLRIGMAAEPETSNVIEWPRTRVAHR